MIPRTWWKFTNVSEEPPGSSPMENEAAGSFQVSETRQHDIMSHKTAIFISNVVGTSSLSKRFL